MSLIPLSPFGGGMRASQNSKLGTGNSCRDWTEFERSYLSCSRLYFGSVLIVSTEKLIKTLIKLLFRESVALGAKTHQRYPIAT